MKKISGWASVLLAVLLCLGMFAGCSEAEESSSSESSSETSSDTSSETSSSEEESSQEEALEEDVIGEVTYIGSSSLVLDVFEPSSEVTDYTALEGITLTDTEESRTVTLEEDATFQEVKEGALTEITKDDLPEGVLVAVTTDDEGVQTVIILDVETDEGSTEDTESVSTAETSALEEAAGE